MQEWNAAARLWLTWVGRMVPRAPLAALVVALIAAFGAGPAHAATGTTTSVSSSANPSVFGQSVSFTATVTPQGAGTPTGTVTFTDGLTTIGTAPLVGGIATFTTSGLSIGNHTIAALYSGDANFNNSSGTVTGGQQVNPASTVTTVTSSVNPAVFGQSVTFTATLSVVAPGNGTPTGTVTFLDGGSPIGTGTVVGNTATFTTSALSPGNHTITTSYGGDTNFNGSTGSLLGGQTVNPANTSTTVTSSANPAVFSQAVTFTATVSPVAPGSGTPTGTVTFLDNGAPIGTGTLSGGTATFTTSTLSVGPHTITTSYGGDTNFNGSTGSLTGNPQVISPDNTTINLQFSQNPSVFGQAVTYTATVNPIAPGSGTPTGTMEFLIDGTPNLVPLVNGQASFTTSSLTPGNHNVQAIYGGDTNFAPSTSGALIQTVNKANTTTALVSSMNPSAAGQSVTFTATVNVSAPGGGTPTGNIQFTIDGSTQPPVTLIGGQAAFTTASLTAGSHAVIATYSGDTDFNNSQSSTLTQVVQPAATHFSISAPATATHGAPFSFTITALDQFNNTATLYNGTVHFTSTDGAASLPANATLTNGVGTFTATLNTPGAQTITGTDTVTSAITGTSGTINVFGAATHFSFTTPATAIHGTPFNFTITALDGSNNVAGTYAGTVHFSSTDGAATLPANATLTNGTGTFSATLQTTGSQTITGTDTVTASINGTSSPITVSLNTTTTTLTAAPNPSTVGQAVTLTATVTGNGGPGTPTGTVRFFDGGTQIGAPVALSGSGVATLTTTSLPPGQHSLTAIYSGDANFASSTSAATSETVGQATTTTTLASSQNPSVHNQPVTFTATVSSGGGTPTGTVTFLDSGQAIGTGTLAAGVATFTTSTLTIGAHAITASYGGSALFQASTSAVLNQAVNEPADSLKLRAMQVQGSQIAAQLSGDAFSEAVDAAINDGFTDQPSFATPSANGIHVNLDGQLSASQQLSDDAYANTPDPALGRAIVLSDNGTKPAMATFYSLSSANNANQPPGALPKRPGQSDPSQVASLDPAKPGPGQTQTAAAPVLVGPTPSAWQAWADIRGSGWDNSASAGDVHGTQVNTIVGLTRRLTPDFLVGALGGYEHFNYSSQLLNGRLVGDGWTAGGYLGWRLDQQLRFDAALAHSDVSYNGVAGTASGSFPGSRWLASAGLAGTYKLMPFDIEPSAKVFALWEHEDPYTDSLGTPQSAFHFTTGRASAGFKLSYPMPWTPSTGLTPYVGIYGDYYFSSNNGGTVLVPSTFIRGGAGRVTAGITARLDSGVKLALGGEYGGIGNDFQNWTVMGRVSIPLTTLFGLPEPFAAGAAPVTAAAAHTATPAPAKQVASLQPAADATVAPVAQTTDAPAIPPERIVVGFSQHALFLTADGRRAFDEAVADLLAKKSVQIAIEGCDVGADFTDGSLCARRQAALQQLLESKGIFDTAGALATP